MQRSLLFAIIMGAVLAPIVYGAEAYRLGVGDTLRLTVFGEPDLSGEFQVDSTGNLALSLVGPRRVVNQTLRQAEATIMHAYADGYLQNPQISLELLTARPFFIMGEVNLPGQYSYQENLTVLNAVAIAGGYTYRANQRKITLKRGPSQSPTSVGAGTRIQPGDVIIIPERFF